MNHNLVELGAARKILIEYLIMKVKEEDWHGVADAAMDLREVEAELRVYKGLEK